MTVHKHDTTHSFLDDCGFLTVRETLQNDIRGFPKLNLTQIELIEQIELI